MTEITVANTDAAIIDDLKEALANATISGIEVFARVEIICSPKQASQKFYTDGPLALVHYERTEEYVITDLKRGEVVGAILTLAAKANSESARLTEATRLKNAAMNAVDLSPPDDAEAFGVDGDLHRMIEWGEPSIDTSSKPPWVVCTLPLKIAYTIENKNSH